MSTGDITTMRLELSMNVTPNVSKTRTVKYMNGQMQIKHANGGRKEFVSMKKITQVMTLNLCPAKNEVHCVYINEWFPL